MNNFKHGDIVYHKHLGKCYFKKYTNEGCSCGNCVQIVFKESNLKCKDFKFLELHGLGFTCNFDLIYKTQKEQLLSLLRDDDKRLNKIGDEIFEHRQKLHNYIESLNSENLSNFDEIAQYLSQYSKYKTFNPNWCNL